jgi:hypothetical protein
LAHKLGPTQLVGEEGPGLLGVALGSARAGGAVVMEWKKATEEVQAKVGF